ncbi:regulator of chromosome condensation 1/beta-lactamase-inhibitor protein II [Thermothelomyces heterothallicus CBS 202.75]|uniref:regulator of chromosome condensation 1/beta-lactamase-inhibitor protein II n=1 Tax=Thermothelomyces heterothallicus CBS 202.75 TaxID=1149848 RepID=UPI003744220F
MFKTASPLLTRTVFRQPSSLRTLAATSAQCARYSSSTGPTQRVSARAVGLLTVAVASGAGTLWAYPRLFGEPQPAGPAPPEAAEIVYEKPRKKAADKEESRELVSPQHVQVKRSWEHPGVYAWGSNAGKVVAPDSNETVIKTPRRIPYFDGKLLRDLKLDRDFGVAVTEEGDLVQWGTAFSKDAVTPTVTLKGKDLSKIAVSRDRIIALSSNGSVYSIPVAKSDQESGEKPTSKSWLPFWSAEASMSYRLLTPPSLGWGEKVIDVKSGQEHCLLLTSKGRVFSAASSSEEFPSKGQLGVPGLTWHTRPAGPYDQPHEVKALSNIKAIAAGAFHSLALDDRGRAFSFGDNSSGQLGFETDVGAIVDKPSLLPVHKLYSGTGLVPKVTSIGAGGHNSYFTVDATKTQGQNAQETGRTVADTWACGAGIYGGLGTGKWTHVSAIPTKIKALSSLYEYDEATNRVTPIRLAQLAVGSTHACAVLDNLTRLTAPRSSTSGSDTDTNFGADVLWWGGNEHYQLGTGKRNNVSVPVYIAPLDGGRAGDADKSGVGEPPRFQLTPRTTVRLGEGGKGRKASVEQRIECGRFVTAVYSGS